MFSRDSSGLLPQQLTPDLQQEDHKQTMVKLPCFVGGNLEEPKDNDGRPRLVIPASIEVVFIYVG